MGNVASGGGAGCQAAPPEFSSTLESMFRTAEARSEQALEWYLQDRMRDERRGEKEEEEEEFEWENEGCLRRTSPLFLGNAPSPATRFGNNKRIGFFYKLANSLSRMLLLWSSGRKVGTRAVEKIVGSRGFLANREHVVLRGKKSNSNKNNRRSSTSITSSATTCVLGLASASVAADRSWPRPGSHFAESEVHKQQLEELVLFLKKIFFLFVKK